LRQSKLGRRLAAGSAPTASRPLTNGKLNRQFTAHPLTSRWRLKAHASRAIAERLEQDHTVGRRLAAASGQAVDAYTACQTESGAKLAAAARGYASFLREHIDLETREVLPAVEGPLAAYRGGANRRRHNRAVARDDRRAACTHQSLRATVR